MTHAATGAGRPQPADAGAPGPRPWRGGDLPSWLSPMVVKELRQGLQSGFFTWTVLALHLGMVLLLSGWIMSAGEDPGDTTCRDLFWMLTSLCCLAVIPLRGITALGSEHDGQTFDLLRLTRLSSTQIVVGKWLAILAQVGLVAVTLLPYVVLQYYLGGYDVIDDLVTVGCLVVLASLITAAAISTSTQTALNRGFFVMAVVVLVATGFGAIASSTSTVSLSRRLGLVTLASIPLVIIILEYAAAAIAPRSENHALRKRALALGFVTLATGAGIGSWWQSPGQSALVAVAGGAWTIAAGIALGELLTDAVPLRVIHEPFAACPPLAWIFTPGWATAVVFALLIGAVFVAWMPTVPGRLDNPFATTMAAAGLIAALLFPVPFTTLVSPRYRAAMYAVVALATCVLPVIGLIVLGPSAFEALWSVLPLPCLLTIAENWSRGGPEPALAGVVPLVTTVLVWLPFLPSWYRQMSLVSQRVAACRTPRDGAPAGRPA